MKSVQFLHCFILFHYPILAWLELEVDEALILSGFDSILLLVDVEEQ